MVSVRFDAPARGR